MRFGGSGEGDGMFKRATGIAVDIDGNIFVSDYETKRVQKFDTNGNFISAWLMGEDIDVKGTPEGLTVDVEGHVYVTDYELGRLQVFDNDGAFMWAIGGKTRSLNALKRPTAVVISKTDQIIIVNQSAGKLTIIQKP